jgi:tetratricopeptide (TPR) repeat protein
LAKERETVAENARIDDLRRRLEREPGSRVFAQLAEELRKAGQLAEAIRVARQGLLNHPGYPSARMTLGRALMDTQDLKGARAEFEAVLRGAPDNILASRYLGECLESLGDLGSALLQYRATLRLVPGDRNLEAQISALEARLTPTLGAPAPPAPPPPPPRPAAASRPPLPMEGAIPVLDVDEPMELEGRYDEQTTPWRPAPVIPDAAPVAAASPEPQPVPEPEPVVEVPPAEVAAPSGRGAAEDRVEPLDESFSDWELSEPSPPPPSAPPPATSEAPPLSSSTLAELYFNQGFTRQAIDVYREILDREPGNERIRARIAELEAIAGPVEGPAPAKAPPGEDRKARRRRAIERTIGRLEGFLATVRRA